VLFEQLPSSLRFKETVGDNVQLYTYTIVHFMFRKISKTQGQEGIIFQQPKFSPKIEMPYFLNTAILV